jgi:hypothetical protein
VNVANKRQERKRFLENIVFADESTDFTHSAAQHTDVTCITGDMKTHARRAEHVSGCLEFNVWPGVGDE